VGRCRLSRSYHASFIASWCNNRGGEAAGLHRHDKKVQQKQLYASSDSSRDAPYTLQDMATVSKTGPTFAMGSAKAQGSKTKFINGSEPPRATRVRDEATQRMANILAHPVPHRGDPASSSFVSESTLGGFFHAPLGADM
jgi:hypothetical protein